jgi:DNA replication protein DnaC
LIPEGRSNVPKNRERFRSAYRAAQTFAQEPRGWLIFEGASGCGKTHLATAIVNYCLVQGHPAFFIAIPDLLDHLRSTFSPTSEISYDELFEQVCNAPLLVLDDLGGQSSTSWAREKLHQLISRRFNSQLPTVITTSTPLEELEERLRSRLGDSTLCQRYLVEERRFPVWDHFGELGLELLSNMDFENFDCKRLDLPVEQRRNLEDAFRLARNFAETPDGWLIFQGTNGCGKTHLAAAIANYRLRRGKEVFFVTVPDFIDHLRSTFAPDSRTTYDELFELVKKAPLLILDDFGEQTSTPWAHEKLYQLINYRYNARLPSVVTTCRTLEEIEGRVSSRMADPRISLVFQIEAPDYRADRHVAEEPKPKRRSRTGRRA